MRRHKRTEFDCMTYENETFDELPEEILCSNFSNCTFNCALKFECCNFEVCTFNQDQYFYLSNLVNCLGQDTSTFELSNNIIENFLSEEDQDK